jgi:hypothetical protein
MVWNEYNSWIPRAFMLHDRQDSEILAAGTRQVKHWCGNSWLHTLTDDSADEQAAMEKAWSGLEAGEQEITYLPCTVNSERTFWRASHTPAFVGLLA